MKNWVKLSILALSCYTSLYSALCSGAVILQYHHVADDSPAITSVSVERFTEQMNYLDDEGFIVISLNRMIQHLLDGKPLPDKSLAITFDDAYHDTYLNAYPQLKKHGFPFTVFIATDFIGPSAKSLSWNQIEDMRRHGASIANHSRSHPHMLQRLPGEREEDWLARLRSEILDAQNAIDQHSDQTQLKLFAFPYGEYDLKVLRLIVKLGYIGFGQQSGAIGINSNFAALPRFPIAGNYSDMESFKIKSNTLPLPIKLSYVDPLLKPGETLPELTLSFSHDFKQLKALTCYGPEGKMNIEQVGHLIYKVRPTMEVPLGRSRYNCTMPAMKEDQFYWYSQLWIRRFDDGTWFPEPI